MKINKYSIALLGCLIFGRIQLGLTQQVNQLGNFMYNQLYYNPASAGMHETQVNLNIIGAVKWTSIDGAPKLAHLWGDYRFPSENMALGVNLGTFTYSKYKISDVNLNYAYFISLNKKVKLSMGLRAGATGLFSSTENSIIWDDSDPLVAKNNYAATLPKIGLGFQLNAPNGYLGFSSPDLYISDTQKLLDDTTSFINQKRNYILMGGAKIRLNDLYNLRPSIIGYYYPSGGANLHANLTFEIRDYFWLGGGYSTYKSVSITAGAHLSTRIRFAYAYEFLAGIAGTTAVGSHEVNLMFKLDNLARKKSK